MSTFTNFIIHAEYASIAALGDRLGEIRGLLDWDAFRSLLADLYTNDTTKGGRPNCDVVLMIRLLVLQQWYGLSDTELERQATDRISFRHFLGYPETITDRSTIWLFRERLAQTGKNTVIWGRIPAPTRNPGSHDQARDHSGCDLHHRRSRACLRGYSPGRPGPPHSACL